ATAQSCKNYVIISTRGTYELQGPSIAFPGMINATLAAIANGVEYDTVYPAAANQTYYFGTNDIVNYIKAGLASCPDQRYVLLGYSQGAIATNVALQNFTDASNTQVYDAIRAVLVVGNPAHIAGSNANYDEFGTTLTRNYNGSYYVRGTGFIPDVFYKDHKVLDICHTKDSVCAPTYPNATFVPDHLLYGTTPQVQTEGAAFIISQL
ncbi:carbohydrate esterase family 5 protein, partial [Myriangium duriaei CBS 260.36]